MAAATAAAAEEAEEADPRPRDVELAYRMHKSGARLDPFVDGSAHDLKRWAERGNLKGPWSVRYGEGGGRPRWMKRVLPEFRSPAAAAAAEGVKDEEAEKETKGEGDGVI